MATGTSVSLAAFVEGIFYKVLFHVHFYSFIL